MTSLDTAILDATKKLGITPYPFFIDEGKILVGDNYVDELPILIQNIMDNAYEDENGFIVREIDFYLLTDFDVQNYDVYGKINPKYENLTNAVFNFIELLRSSFDVELKDRVQKYRQQTTIPDLGVAFTLVFKYRPCSL